MYFDSFAIEYIPQKEKSIKHNIFRMQDDDSIMFGLYCITFIENMLVGKTLLDYVSFLSPEAIYNTIYKDFKQKQKRTQALNLDLKKKMK